MKIFNNFHEKLPMGDDSVSTTSTTSAADKDIPDATTTSEHIKEKPGSDFLPDIFSSSQLPSLFKFESEDSGVELPSGADSPSTPTGSEQSFVVHSRESSCDSYNMNSEPSSSPHELVRNPQNSNNSATEEPIKSHTNLDLTVETSNDSEQREESGASSEEHSTDLDQSRGSNSDSDEVKLRRCEENKAPGERTCSENQKLPEKFSIRIKEDRKPESVRRNATRNSLEEYMEECCRLSQEAPQTSSSPGSGLGYLEHICQLLEKIGHLQELNLQLQRQICALQKDGRMTKTKEELFQQHCSCGAATLAFQIRLSRSEFFSPSGTVSDLSTIPEGSRNPLMSTRGGLSSESSSPIPLWRRSLSGRSSSEGEEPNTEGLSISQRRVQLGENYTWSRVKEIVKKTKLRNQSRLGLTSTSLKMSCPQLYRPDLDPVESAGGNRRSMTAFNSQSKLDLWLQ